MKMLSLGDVPLVDHEVNLESFLCLPKQKKAVYVGRPCIVYGSWTSEKHGGQAASLEEP